MIAALLLPRGTVPDTAGKVCAVLVLQLSPTRRGFAVCWELSLSPLGTGAVCACIFLNITILLKVAPVEHNIAKGFRRKPHDHEIYYMKGRKIN